MASLLSTLGEVVTFMYTQVVNVVTMVVQNDLLLVVSGIMIAGAAIALFGRVLSRG